MHLCILYILYISCICCIYVVYVVYTYCVFCIYVMSMSIVCIFYHFAPLLIVAIPHHHLIYVFSFCFELDLLNEFECILMFDVLYTYCVCHVCKYMLPFCPIIDSRHPSSYICVCIFYHFAPLLIVAIPHLIYVCSSHIY